ncbi:MAG TPA: UbiA family prenyltransferase [Flavisolibacter sp.]|jgi:4-hydroxybenzoate polyprenyltransferase|nr:UbiA family prenyltransferase [Flavisolibacter sp.]
MVYQTCLLFSIPFSFALAGFVFSGSVCSYNFHWYLTPPHVEQPTEKEVWNISNKRIHMLLFIVGLIGSAVFTVLLIKNWFWLGVTAFVTFLYSAPKITHPLFSHLKKVAVGKTIFLAFAWMHVTALLPLVIETKVLGYQHIWFVVNRFFYIYAICILFDYRDVEEDKKAGIRSLITYLDEKGVDRLFWGSVATFVLTLVLLINYFSIAEFVALLIPGIILSLLYYPSKKNFSDYLYYFILDGLMMLSAPLLLLIKFAR